MVYTFTDVVQSESGIDIQVDGLDCGLHFGGVDDLVMQCGLALHPVMHKIGEYAGNLQDLVGVTVNG